MMIKLINDLWFKRRDIISDGYDASLEYISQIIPLAIHSIPTGTRCWTWKIPEKWTVKEAFIEDLDSNRILDIRHHPLHVMSYSLPINSTVSRQELLEHLHTNPCRPGAIPFEFKYYERDWGFCIQHDRLKELTGDKYRVFIDSRFEEGSLKIGEYTVKGKSDKTIILVAHLCHPAMVNDDLSGVAVLVDIAKQISQRRNLYTYKFLLVPETIGSIAYLSKFERIIPKIGFGIFLEMLGNNNVHALQFSRQGDTRIDRVAHYALKQKGGNFRIGPFRSIIVNDEMVFNGPGVDIPMISISRFPYPEYHTSDDNPSIISVERLTESRDLVLKILEIMDTDYLPKRKFRGPIFLSGFGLWVDWRINPKLNEAIDRIMLRLEGKESVFEIAQALGIDFADAYDFLEKLYQRRLIDKKR